MSEFNASFNSTPEVYEDHVIIIQYVAAVFSAFATIPNLIIIFLLLKSKLAQLAEYAIILNWSLFNIAFIANYFYLYVIPNDQVSDIFFSFLYNLSTVIITATSVLVAMLNIDYVLDSDKFYKHLIFIVWLYAVLFGLGLVLTYFTETIDVVFILYYSQNISLALLSFIFVLNLFLVALKSDSSKSSKARLILSLIYLLNFILQLSVGNIIVDEFYAFIFASVSTSMFYLNGLINFIILLASDSDVRDYLSLEEDDKSEVAKDVDL